MMATGQASCILYRVVSAGIDIQMNSAPRLATVSGRTDSRFDTDTSMWLAWQCSFFAGLAGAALFELPRVGPGRTAEPAQSPADDAEPEPLLTACWPDQRCLPGIHQVLKNHRAVRSAEAIAYRTAVGPFSGHPAVTGDDALDQYLVYLPERKPTHLLVIIAARRNDTERIATVKLVQWGAHWLARAPDSIEPVRAPATTRLLQSDQRLYELATQPSTDAATQYLADMVHRDLGCQRVSVGLVRLERVRLKAISGMPGFDGRLKVVRQIENLLQGCVDAGTELAVSEPGSDVPLLERFGADTGMFASAHTVTHRDTTLVILLQWPSGEVPGGKDTNVVARTRQSVDNDYLQQLQAGFQIMVALLSTHQPEISPWRYLVRWLRDKSTGWTPQNMTRRQALLAGIFVAVLASAVIPGRYSIPATVKIEGAVRQMVVAPYEGYIKSVAVRVGDLVSQNQLLLQLDDQDLLMQKQKWLSEVARLEQVYRQALAAGNRIEMSLVSAERDAAAAELQLVEHQLARGSMRAPVDGVIVSGEQYQKLGAPVSKGDNLFEVASTDSFRVVLEVGEKRIGDVQQSQIASIRLAALPDRVVRASIEQPMPVAVSRDKDNRFRVSASLLDKDAALRPGMEGVARIAVDRRPLLWIWTHRLIDRMQIWLWSKGL